ncbi:Crp/Fnr family transcriptional regulator [Mangrovivirga sp. M17]|uniref:Crp/Fnr family transcriptional regulator n=1 Tax=Mangrovivirga halotolerans TaxID=2993936 RepID=A0ABT3RVT2_9BACT|nr:Crp/Fnr family transcriptional regulator [Mangrovivirga halotolerans]MCX2745453.1 Crp/Fnr family transcriptional regulator [Mangrovivirga halotolerans]
MPAFKNRINSLYTLPDEAFDKLEESTQTKTLKNNDFLLDYHSICRHIYYIKKGMVRIYYIKDGREITEWFAYDDNFCFSIISYFNEEPSNLIIQCIEDSEIILLPKKSLEKLSDIDLNISKLYRSMFATSLILSQYRMEALQFETAFQRYEKLMANDPEIIKRAPLKYIASYLGITFETLSRIRNQLH